MIGVGWFVPLFPLLGFLIISFGNRFLKGKTAGYIASITLVISFLLSLYLFYLQQNGSFISKSLYTVEWITVGKFRVSLELLIDPLSVIMMLIVTGIGLLIHIYSIGYMEKDERFNAFFAQMNLFSFSMLLLVMGANYLLMFIGWEGVGFCSYLLIGFWFKKTEYNIAAKKAFIMNRIGDLGFLLGIILIFFVFGSLNYSTVFAQTIGINPGNNVIIWITMLLMIGALGKSAQIPLYTWLPDAMAGPTPVSALIHAATMVTAGIYMIVRSNALFVLAPFTLTLIIVIGIATAILTAVIGLMQNDIKKVLAYSTISQLGYMFMALGIGAFTSSMFHLTTHAFFKALLFLAAGSVIHALHGAQDIRGMGGLKKKIPLTYFTFLIATLAISGIPPFSGFFSKDEILIRAYEYSPLLWIFGMIGALLTCFYMFRLLFLVFHGSFRGTEEKLSLIHESPKVMTWPLIILAILALGGGLMNIPALFGNNSMENYLQPVIAGNFAEKNVVVSHSTEYILMAVSFVMLLVVIYLAFNTYLKKKSIPAGDEIPRKGLARVVYHKYYLDEIYNILFVKPYEWLSVKLHELFDEKLLDKIVNGAGGNTLRFGNALKYLQNGSISYYLFIMVLGLLAILIYNLV
jgi:NADH-quinone oxidoreductase subunit L